MFKKEGLKISKKDTDWNPKYYGVFVGLFAGLYMITMSITPKMFDLFGNPMSAGIILFPVCCIITDLLTEVYGFNRTRQAIWTVLACVVLFGLFTQIAIILPPVSFWPYQEGFEGIFGISWRLSIAGWAAWLGGEFLNSFVMSKMKILQNAKHMPVRFIGSTVVGQFVDTTLFALIGFAGTMSWSALIMLIVTAWGLKVLYEIVALPLSVPITGFVKRLEGIEHYDYQEISLV